LVLIGFDNRLSIIAGDTVTNPLFCRIYSNTNYKLKRN
jgi:hypothetical protein